MKNIYRVSTLCFCVLCFLFLPLVGALHAEALGTAHRVCMGSNSGIKNTILSETKAREKYVREDCIDFELMDDGDEHAVVVLHADGTVDGIGLDEFFGSGNAEIIRSWKKIKKIVPCKLGNTADGVFGICEDGTVVFCNQYGTESKIDYEKWKNVEKISNSGYKCMVLHKDGTVTAQDGEHILNQDWTDIVDVLVTEVVMAAVGADGTAYVPEEMPRFGNGFKVEWDELPLDAVSFYNNGWMSAAIRKDGSVWTGLYTGTAKETAESWSDMKQLALGFEQLIGLNEDGEILCALTNAEENKQMEKALCNWRDIETLYYGVCFGTIGNDDLVIGIQNNGKLKISGWAAEDLAPMLEWEDVVKVQGDIYAECFVGLSSDGRLLIHNYKDAANTGDGAQASALSMEAYAKQIVDDEDVQLPKKSSYLNLAKWMFIDAPKGHSVYTYTEPDSGAGNQPPAYHESRVEVLAVEDEWAFIIYENEKFEEYAAWVNVDNLVELSEKSKGKNVGFGKAIYSTSDTISLTGVEQEWSKLNFPGSKSKFVQIDAPLPGNDCEYVAMDVSYHVISRNGVKDASGERDVYINDGDGWEYVGSFEVDKDLEPMTIHISYDEPREIKAVAVIPVDSADEQCVVRQSVIWLYCREN